MQKPDIASGFFIFGDRNTVQDVLIATTNQKEAVQTA
jgi:hypothetical protein